MGGGVIWLVVAYRRGSFTKGFNLYACPAGASLQSPAAGRSHQRVAACTARRRGVPFTRVKGTKTRLGRCPKTPVAGCAGYGLIYGGSRKSIRTAHRIAPKVAAAHLPFPPTPFPVAGKGPGWAGKIRAAVRCSGYVRACGGGGSRWLGIRSRAPPVADEARRRIRSGRKNRANE